MKYSDASTMAIVNQLYVPISVLLAMFWLGERVALRRWLGIALAFCGVIIFSLDASVSSHLFGVFLLIVDAFSMALGTVLLRRLSGISPFTMQAWMAVIGIPFLFATSFIFESGQIASLSAAPWQAWAALAYTVIAGSLIGHTGYYVLLQHYEVSLVGSVLLLSPAIGVLGGIVILGEPFTPMIVRRCDDDAARCCNRAAPRTAEAARTRGRCVMDFIAAPSPNFDDRPPNTPIDILLLHYTGMPTGAAAVARLCDPEAQVSAHYTVDEDGTIFAHVPEDRRAWHAGVSWWAGERNVNARSIGIEIVNPGHEFGYRSFPDLQIEAVIELCREVVQRRKIPPRACSVIPMWRPRAKSIRANFFPGANSRWLVSGLWPQTRKYALDVPFEAGLRAFGYGLRRDVDVPHRTS